MSYKKTKKGSFVIRKNGVEVMPFSVYRGICSNKHDKDKDTDNEAYPSKEKNEREYHHTHKFKGVAKLVILLGEVCDSNERHIKYHVLR